MAIIDGLSRSRHFSEFNNPLPNNAGGYTAPSARKALAVANLGFTQTAAAISAAASGTRGIVSVPDATPYTVLAADSGKTHILPNFTATTTINLPTAAAGLEYTFIGKAVAADAQNWIFAAGVAYLGGLTFVDNDAGAGADEMHAGVYPNGTTNDNMTIVTPAAGTYITLVCDGTNWIVNGFVNSATVPTFAD